MNQQHFLDPKVRFHMASNTNIFVLLAGACLFGTTAARAQQAFVTPNFPSYEERAEVPTLNLPQQTDPTIGQTDQPSTSTEIIRSQGETQVNDPTVAPLPGISPSDASTFPVDSQPVVGRNPVENPPRSTGVSPSGRQKYTKGMILEGKVHVADGHSLLVGEHAVRLNGVEAPGLKQLCFATSGSPWRCGIASVNRLKSLAEGKKAVCRVEAPAGDGAAATCAVQGISDVSRILLQEGMVVTNRYAPPAYREMQSQARHYRAGLWVGTFTNPADWRKKNR